MIEKIKKRIEKERSSKDYFWQLFFLVKDFFWKCKENAKQIIEGFQEALVPLRVNYVCGPTKINYSKNELAVVCLIKNGEACIKDFIEHYLSIGARHIVFLDINSTDRTVEIAVNMARGCKRVTVLKSNIPSRNDKEECRLKRYLAKRFCRNHWVLCADVDEFLDWPYSNAISLSRMLDYLNMNRYNAVVTQMLDMFSDKPLDEHYNKKMGELYRYYDIANIQKEDYSKGPDEKLTQKNVLSNKNIKLYMGGIRKTVFNANNLLTKHSLFFLGRGLKPFPYSVHFVSNAKIADFTAVLYHYKFNKDFYKSSLSCVENKLFPSCMHEYENYVKTIEKNPYLVLKQKTSKKLKNVNDLVKNRFLVISENYKKNAGKIKEMIEK